MLTQKRTATKTPNSLPLFCFYLMLFTIWAVVPARAETAYDTVYRAPESARIHTTFNAKGDVDSVVIIKMNSAPANVGVSRNLFFGGRSLAEKDLTSEQASED